MFSSDVGDDEIARRISDFRIRAENGISDDSCIGEVSSIFGGSFSFPTEMRSYEEGVRFYRVRAIPSDDTVIPLRTIRQVGDAWEPPSHVITAQGRLNAIGQSVLYCCPGDPELAIDEARARDHRHVAVMVYRASRPISVATLGDYQNSGLPKDDRSRSFYTFLDDEFSRVILPGQEGRYSITRAIADTYFNYPEQDAWCYRSVQSPEKFNVAFLPGKSRDSLDLVGVMICTPGVSGAGVMQVKFVVDFDEESGEARYHHLGTEGQLRIFPEIVMR